MCGRLTLTQKELREVAALVGAEVPPAHEAACARHRPRYNVAPGQDHWIVRLDEGGRRVLEPARFGMRGRFSKAGVAPFNARSESVLRVAAFREAFQAGRRVIVPADGYYEWTGPRKDRRPIRFSRRDGQLLLFAALCAPEIGDEGAVDSGFAILTAGAAGELAPFHDRVPVALSPAQVDAWLGGRADTDEGRRALLSMLGPIPDGALAWRPASRRVNRVENDDPACLDPEPDPPAGPEGTDDAPGRARQLGLF